MQTSIYIYLPIYLFSAAGLPAAAATLICLSVRIDNMHKCWPLITTTQAATAAAAAATATAAVTTAGTTCFWSGHCLHNYATGRSWQKYYKGGQRRQQQQRQRRQLQFVRLHEAEAAAAEAGAAANSEPGNSKDGDTHTGCGCGWLGLGLGDKCLVSAPWLACRVQSVFMPAYPCAPLCSFHCWQFCCGRRRMRARI